MCVSPYTLFVHSIIIMIINSTTKKEEKRENQAKNTTNITKNIIKTKNTLIISHRLELIERK